MRIDLRFYVSIFSITETLGSSEAKSPGAGARWHRAPTPSPERDQLGHRGCAIRGPWLPMRTRQEAIALFPDHGITLATQLFQPRPVQYRDLATVVFDHTKLLQLAGGFGDTF